VRLVWEIFCQGRWTGKTVREGEQEAKRQRTFWRPLSLRSLCALPFSGSREREKTRTTIFSFAAQPNPTQTVVKPTETGQVEGENTVKEPLVVTDTDFVDEVGLTAARNRRGKERGAVEWEGREGGTLQRRKVSAVW
jgi:hypothetical protein